MMHRILCGDLQENTQMLGVQGRAIAGDLELTWQYPLSEFRPKQTKAACVNPYTMGLYGSQYDYVIHIALVMYM